MTYMDLDTPYELADTIIIGVPYDGTTSYRPGTRFGPLEIRTNSLIGYETYSPKLNKDLIDLKICDLGDIEIPYSDPKEVFQKIYEKSKAILNDQKKIAAIGGEHSITPGIIKAYQEKYPNLKVIHLDAHTDLREDYLGSKYSHASAMKRVVDVIAPKNLYQFGIRSGLKEEFEYAKENINFYPYTLEKIEEVIPVLEDEPVYITIDLDVLDPAYFPGTGTPEPDGVTTRELFKVLEEFAKLKNIVGFDVVELAPKLDNTGASTAIAIKLLRELLMII